MWLPSGEYCGLVSIVVEEISFMGHSGAVLTVPCGCSGPSARQMSKSSDIRTNASRSPFADIAGNTGL